MAGTEGKSVESYLQEGLLAIYPVYDNGDKTVVLTRAGRHQEARSIIWLIRKIVSFYSLDLVTLRRQCGELLNLKHHISLPLSRNLILLPVKTRQVVTPGEVSIGFVSMLEVKEVAPLGPDAAPWLSQIRFKCGAELETCNTFDKVKQRLHQGEIVRQALIKWSDYGICFTGIKRENIIEQLPNCDCLLRDIFMKFLDL